MSDYNIGHKRGYSKGYQAGMRLNKWHQYAPPNPPRAEVAALFQAAKDLRDAAFGVLSCIEPDDGPDGPLTVLQKEAIQVDAAFVQITEWLKQQ